MIDESSKLSSLFKNQQEKMRLELSTSSNLFHSVDNGDNSENAWVEFLSNHLPKRYRVSKATVIDSEGGVSDQLDVVIFDQQYSYLVFQKKGVTYVPAESVYAAFEVKPEMNSSYLTYSSKKAVSVRRLKRTSTYIPTANGLLDPKELHEIIFGVLSNRIALKSLFSEKLEEYLRVFDPLGKITCGCCLEQGAFFVEKGGVRISKGDCFLIYFVIRLVQELQKIGTVPAIDLDAYLSNSIFSTDMIKLRDCKCDL